MLRSGPVDRDFGLSDEQREVVGAGRAFDGGWLLTGTKRFITHAGDAQVYLVMARTGGEGPRGVSAFIVEKGRPGFDFGKLERKMGWNSSPMRELIFDGFEVPAENLVGEE